MILKSWMIVAQQIGRLNELTGWYDPALGDPSAAVLGALTLPFGYHVSACACKCLHSRPRRCHMCIIRSSQDTLMERGKYCQSALSSKCWRCAEMQAAGSASPA